MVVADVGDVPTLLVPDPAVEVIHPISPSTHRLEGVPVDSFGILPSGEEPSETVLALGAVIQELALVESVLAGTGDHSEVVEFCHGRPPCHPVSVVALYANEGGEATREIAGWRSGGPILPS